MEVKSVSAVVFVGSPCKGHLVEVHRCDMQVFGECTVVERGAEGAIRPLR